MRRSTKKLKSIIKKRYESRDTEIVDDSVSEYASDLSSFASDYQRLVEDNFANKIKESMHETIIKSAVEQMERYQNKLNNMNLHSLSLPDGIEDVTDEERWGKSDEIKTIVDTIKHRREMLKPETWYSKPFVTKASEEKEITKREIELLPEVEEIPDFKNSQNKFIRKHYNLTRNKKMQAIYRYHINQEKNISKNYFYIFKLWFIKFFRYLIKKEK